MSEIYSDDVLYGTCPKLYELLYQMRKFNVKNQFSGIRDYLYVWCIFVRAFQIGINTTQIFKGKLSKIADFDAELCTVVIQKFNSCCNWLYCNDKQS
jgi:hypothetical protein